MSSAFHSWKKENEEATTGTLEVGLRHQCSFLKEKLCAGILPDPIAGPRTRWCLSFPPCAVGVFPHLCRHRSPSMHTHLLPETTDYHVDSDLCARGEVGRPPHLPCLRHPADDVTLLCLFLLAFQCGESQAKHGKHSNKERRVDLFCFTGKINP
jgi:hypothetical protein